MKGDAMNENDTALENEALSEIPRTPAAERKPPRKARCTRRALVQDARTLLRELYDGLSAEEIRAKYGWTESAHRRRRRAAADLAKRDYDPAYVFAVFLRHETQFRHLQRQARAHAEQIRSRIRQASAEDKSAEAALYNALTSTLKFIGDCENKIMNFALDLKIIPSEKGSDRDATFADLVRASFTVEEARQAGVTPEEHAEAKELMKRVGFSDEEISGR
jgi:hypothetical protein